MKRNGVLCLLALLAGTAAGADTAADVVRKSLEREGRNWERAKDYTFQEKAVQREVDPSGKVTKTESELIDVTILYGRPIRRVVEKNGKPLSDKDKAKEDERFNKELEKRRKETSEENTRERRRYEENRARQRQFAKEVPEAFNFTQLADDQIGGKPVYVIRAEPKAGYRPRDMRAKFLPKIHGKLWIDKESLEWVKIEAETTDTISFGWFLARVGPGAQMRFEQQRVNDQVWLPSHVFIKLDARALFKKLRGDIEVTYSNYRKFQTDVKITTVE